MFRMALAAATARLRLAGFLGGFQSYGGAMETEHVSDDRLQQLVGRFHALRPLVPGIGRCLPQSLVLRDFLALHDVEAEIVFGVRSAPFAAHCWVERRNVVLNDTVDHVRQFAPIYAC